MMSRPALALAGGLLVLAGLTAFAPVHVQTTPRKLRLDVRGQRLLLGLGPVSTDPDRPLAPRPEPPCAGALRPVSAGGVLTLVLPAPPSSPPVLYREGLPGGRSLDADWRDGGWACRRGPAGTPWSVELAEAPEAVRWTVVVAPPSSGTTVVSFITTGLPAADFRVTPELNLVETTSVTSAGAGPPTRSPVGNLDLASEVRGLGLSTLSALSPALFLAALALVAGAMCPARRLLRHPVAALGLTLLVLLPGLGAAGSALLAGLVWWGLAAPSQGPLPSWRVLALMVPALGLALLHPLPGTAFLVVLAAAVASRPGDDGQALRGLLIVATASALAILVVPILAPGPATHFMTALRASGFSHAPGASFPWGEAGFGPARAVLNLHQALTALAGTLGPGLALWPLGLVLLGARAQTDAVLPLVAIVTLGAAASGWTPDVLPAGILAVLAGSRALLLILTRAEEEAP